MSKGIFITLEGLDGSGKTTQLKLLAEWLNERGHSPLVTRQPGGTATGDKIRALLLTSRGTGIAPMTEMALMFADRAQAIAEVIRPALNQGQIVLCDRFTDSTEAYQGGGRELGSELVLALHKIICGNLHPDLTLLLLPDLEPSLERARKRNQKAQSKNGDDENRFELEADAFHARVWQKYHDIANREPNRVELIEGSLTIEQVHERILARVQKIFAGREE